MSMSRVAWLSCLVLAAGALPARAASEKCVACHERLTPGIVTDWKLSRHARESVGCETCHGATHVSAEDVALARLPTPDTCAPCHEQQVNQFKRGKHARAWAAVKALPTFHHLDESKPDDPAGCATCHRIGLKSPAEAAALKKAGATHGMASCDACHTRHLFSKAEAREPAACRTCHGDLQYEAWAGSKHGERHLLKSQGRLPDGVAAPTCQVCHMPDGDHRNRTPWGSLGMRLPLPEDPAWAADRRDLFRALGVLDAAGNPGPRSAAVEAAGIAHLDRVDYQNERARLTNACRQCHALPFIREQLDVRDGVLKDADRLSANAVRTVAALVAEGRVPDRGNGGFPDLVAGATGSPVEQRLARMFFETRGKLLAVAFHMSPDLPKVRTALARDAAEVERLAAGLRTGAGNGPGAAPAAKKRPAATAKP